MAKFTFFSSNAPVMKLQVFLLFSSRLFDWSWTVASASWEPWSRGRPSTPRSSVSSRAPKSPKKPSINESRHGHQGRGQGQGPVNVFPLRDNPRTKKLICPLVLSSATQSQSQPKLPQRILKRKFSWSGPRLKILQLKANLEEPRFRFPILS